MDQRLYVSTRTCEAHNHSSYQHGLSFSWYLSFCGAAADWSGQCQLAALLPSELASSAGPNGDTASAPLYRQFPDDAWPAAEARKQGETNTTSLPKNSNLAAGAGGGSTLQNNVHSLIPSLISRNSVLVIILIHLHVFRDIIPLQKWCSITVTNKIFTTYFRVLLAN